VGVMGVVGGGVGAVGVAGVIEACGIWSMFALGSCSSIYTGCACWLSKEAMGLTLQAWTGSVPNPRGAWKVETGRRKTVCGLSQPMQLGTA
jgi:hypothetical protein